jgi:hypothetical protein
LHARLHHAFLQLGRDEIQPLARRDGRRVTDDSLNIGNVLSFLEEDSVAVRNCSHGEASEEKQRLKVKKSRGERIHL